MARVIISAGHTQTEPGAVNQNLREVDLTRKIANKITQILRNKGIITLSVPPELDLLARIDWINKTGYSEQTDDISIEIHINDGGKSGLEGWYKGKDENPSKKLTATILKEASKKTTLQNHGAKSEYEHPLQSLAFLHNTNTNSALLECLYIDNPSDQKFLQDDSKLDLLANGIVKGILEYFDIDDISDKTTPPAAQAIKKPIMPIRAAGATGATFSPPPSQPQPFAPTYPSYQPPKSQSPQDKQERKKAVETKYQQILGRKVNEQDLTYFLNLGLTEEQMLKRLVESQEHADMVTESQDYKKIKPEYDKQKLDLQKLTSQVSDKDEIIKKQNELIDQKNKSIQNLGQQQPPSSPVTPTVTSSTQYPQNEINTGYQEVKPQKEGVFNKISRKLSDVFD